MHIRKPNKNKYDCCRGLVVGVIHEKKSNGDTAFKLQQRADSNRHTATANSTDGHPAASVNAGTSSS